MAAAAHGLGTSGRSWWRAAVLLAVMGALGACGGRNSPEGLRRAVETAIKDGDWPGLRALVELEGAPALQLFALADLLPECAEAAAGCTVELKELDDAWLIDFQARVAAQQLAVPYAPEGLLVISNVRPGSTMKVRLPFGQVNGQFKVVAARIPPARLEELAAIDARKAAADALAAGLPAPASGDPDPAWQGTASELPPGGGEPGAAWLAQIEQRNAAIAALDPEALAKLTGEWGKVVFSATDYAGNPVPPQARKLKVTAQAVRFVAHAEVLGGWASADRAALIVDGRDHSGNLRRGAVFLEQTADGWSQYAEKLVEIPQD